jgi:hypothetical protein
MHKFEKILIAVALFLLIIIVILTALVLNTPTKTTAKSNSPEPTLITKSNTTYTQTSSSPQNTIAPTPTPQITEKTYTGEYFSFKYQSNWNPTKQPLVPGTVKEIINLGIPDDTTDQTIMFTPLSITQVKPDDIQEESNITIDGQSGKKWIRHGEGYFSYDYYSKDPNSEGSFGIHVTTADRQAELEKALDKLVSTIKFKS